MTVIRLAAAGQVMCACEHYKLIGSGSPHYRSSQFRSKLLTGANKLHILSSVLLSQSFIYKQRVITGRNEVVAKVMFLLMSVILSMGGSPAGRTPLAGRTPWQGGPWQGDPLARRPPARRTPWQGDPPGKEAPLAGRPPLARRPPWQGETPPAGRTPRPRHTVNEWPVRILLECILVYFIKSLSLRLVIALTETYDLLLKEGFINLVQNP